MADLAVLVPSRGRPMNVARLVDACKRTCELDTVLHFGFDSDDPELTSNVMAAGGSLVTTHDRMGLAAWTNQLAREHRETPFLASLGDDMVPFTHGWDRILTGAATPRGMAYPEDLRGPQHGHQPGIPEAIVMDSVIVRALGWMCLPALHHWYVDNVWRDLGTATGCLVFRPDVIVEHRHPNVPGGDKPDATYSDAARRYSTDLAAYQRWRLRGMATDIAAIRRVRTQAPDPL